MTDAPIVTFRESLLAQKETSWEALQQWTGDLNKLLSWLGVLFGAVTLAYVESKPMILSALIFAFPLWLLTYLRATYWYGVNMTVLQAMEMYLNRSLADNGVLPNSLIDCGVFVQSRAGQPELQGPVHPFRAPKTATFAVVGGLLYVLIIAWELQLLDQRPLHCWGIWGSSAVLTFAAYFWFKFQREPRLDKLLKELCPTH